MVSLPKVLSERGSTVFQRPPTKRPWGAVNMSFYDPDNNVIYFRQLQEE